MRRIAIVVLVGLFGNSAVHAQEVMDTVGTSGNTMDVFYSLNNDEVATASRSNWDIAFENEGIAASILINGQNGVTLYSSPFEVNDWNKFDTTGHKSWPTTINSTESWSSGAFNQHLNGDLDLGWGSYNLSTHAVNGDSIFLITLADGSAKMLVIDELSGGVYTFTYADVDGSNKVTEEISKNDIGAQNFGYYSIANKEFVVREPSNELWDIVFTQYLSPIPVGGGEFLNYPVSGVKINKYVQVAQRDGMAVEKDDTTGLSWNTNITEIGSDWKNWNGTEYEYAQDRVYFIRLSNKQVWKIYFTRYEGGPAGAYHFTKKKIASGVGVKDIKNVQASIYPNPASDYVQIQLDVNTALQQVTVLNSTMQEVARFDQNEINTSELKEGIYFLNIETTKGSAFKTLIVE